MENGDGDTYYENRGYYGNKSSYRGKGFIEVTTEVEIFPEGSSIMSPLLEIEFQRR